MVNRDLIAAKLADLARHVDRVRQHKRSSPEELAADPDALDLVAFNLMLCVQICADIASHLISDEGWPAARNLAEGFIRLHEHGVIAQPTASVLAKAVGLRNVVAHGYTGVNPAMVFEASEAGLVDLERFSKEVAGWVAKGPA